MRLQDFLKANPLFCNLSEEQLATVSPYLEKKVFKKEQEIFSEGDPGDGMYLIVFGGVKIRKMIDGVNDKTLATFADGNFFGEMSLVDGYPRSATAVSTRDSVLYKFSRDNFQNLMAAEPYCALSIALSLAGYISMRLRDSNMEVANLTNWKQIKEREGKKW